MTFITTINYMKNFQNSKPKKLYFNKRNKGEKTQQDFSILETDLSQYLIKLKDFPMVNLGVRYCQSHTA
jgi:hypothetical protein